MSGLLFCTNGHSVCDNSYPDAHSNLGNYGKTFKGMVPSTKLLKENIKILSISNTAWQDDTCLLNYNLNFNHQFQFYFKRRKLQGANVGNVALQKFTKGNACKDLFKFNLCCYV